MFRIGLALLFTTWALVLSLKGQSVGSSSPKPFLNIRLGADPAILPVGSRAQAEPHVARSPLHPRILLATFQEGRASDADGGAFACGYASSVDGGLTWSRKLIPSLTEGVDRGPFRRATDPVAAFDGAGNLLLCTLGLSGTGNNATGRIVLSTSTGPADPFGSPQSVFGSDDPTLFPDKSWIAVNTFPGTPSFGRLLASYTSFSLTPDGLNAFGTPIHVTHSEDGGKSWSAPRSVSPEFCQGSIPLFLPDGTVVIGYWNYFVTNTFRVMERPEIVVSKDGGFTFSQPRPMVFVSPHDDGIARTGRDLISLANDAQRGVLFLACQGRLGGVPTIFFSRSRDLGMTWTPLLKVNDTPNAASVFNPAIGVSPDGQHVTILFYDKRHSEMTGQFVDAYLAESFDGGTAWEPNRRVSTVSSDLRKAPLTPRGRMVGDYQGMAGSVGMKFPAIACWIDTRDETPDPYCAPIERRKGTTYDVWKQLRFGPVGSTEAASREDAADPDGDGLSNLVEYALGLEPDAKDPTPVFRAEMGLSRDRQEVLVSYERMNASSDVQGTWQASEDLSHWEEVIPVSEESTEGSRAFLERVVATFEAPPGLRSRFYRLRLARK